MHKSPIAGKIPPPITWVFLTPEMSNGLGGDDRALVLSRRSAALCDCNGQRTLAEPEAISLLMSEIWVGSPKPSVMRHLLPHTQLKW